MAFIAGFAADEAMDGFCVQELTAKSQKLT
jgi:hypothetical protein